MYLRQLEQLERLRSEDTPRRPMITHTIDHFILNPKSILLTRFSRSRPNDLEDIGQGQRSLYATHPLTLVIIYAKYGKNPSRTVDFLFKVKAEKFPKFSSYATHPLTLVIIYAKYGKNPSRTVDFFFKVKAEKFPKFAKNSNFQILKKM